MVDFQIILACFIFLSCYSRTVSIPDGQPNSSGAACALEPLRLFRFHSPVWIKSKRSSCSTAHNQLHVVETSDLRSFAQRYPHLFAKFAPVPSHNTDCKFQFVPLELFVSLWLRIIRNCRKMFFRISHHLASAPLSVIRPQESPEPTRGHTFRQRIIDIYAQERAVPL